MTVGLFLALALSAPARAQSVPKVVHVGTATRTGYEEFSVLGWGEGCSVALRYLRFPAEGQGLRGVPDAFRVGTVTLAPDADAPVARWSYSSDKAGYSDEALQAAAAALREEGRYEKPGTVERLRWARAADQPGLAELLDSTASFKADPPLTGLPARFRFKDVYYSPLVSCGLFVFKDLASPRDGTRWLLARLPEPGVRRQRAKAHVNNALLFYRNEADISSAEAELAVASEMEPRYGLARYHHAALLTLHGRFNEALASLKAAVQQDGTWAAQAREAPEFEPLRDDPRFQAVLASARAARARPPVPGVPGAAPVPKTSNEPRNSSPPDRRHY